MPEQPSKRPFMPSRDLGGSFKINNPDDQTPIREMFKLEDGLLLITDICTYRMQVADQIDPDRKNPALPHNFQQKILDHGVGSELLCRTLLQSKVLFRTEFQKIDVAKAMLLAFDALTNLVAMDETARAFGIAQQAAVEKLSALERGDRSMTVPAIGSVREQCKTFVQKADHFSTALLNLMRMFFPGANNFETLQELVEKEFGAADQFFEMLTLAVPTLVLLRDIRDALEHRLPGVTIKDFEPQADSRIAPPTIEVKFRKSKLDRSSIASFMAEFGAELMVIFELFVVHACARRCQPFAGLAMQVGELPEQYKSAWHVRFAYGAIYADGQFAPCG